MMTLKERIEMLSERLDELTAKQDQGRFFERTDEEHEKLDILLACKYGEEIYESNIIYSYFIKYTCTEQQINEFEWNKEHLDRAFLLFVKLVEIRAENDSEASGK